MIGEPMPNPKDSIIENINQQIDAFFRNGGKTFHGADVKSERYPPRSEKIDPDTILKRRRPSPSHAERIALRRITESL